jgi:two-component system response regulator DctR
MNSNQTIYLCDDDEGVRSALSYLLKKHGFKVSAHGSGPELLAAVDAAPKPVRGLFVLDGRMEPMSGAVVHEQLRSRGLERRNPVIFLSGHGDIPAAVTAMERGALNFVEKPHTEEKLLPLIHQALELEEKWQSVARRNDFLRSMWDSLTPRQRQIALHKAEGELNKVTGDKLGIGERMVEEHWVKVRDKFGVDTVAALATTIAELRASGMDLSVDAGLP